MSDNPNYKVLIAEDDLLVADVLSRKLMATGFNATVVKNGKLALDKLAGEHFDLLLMDLTMPDFDGFQLLTELKELHSVVPIIVMSNLSQPEDINKAKALGAWSYIIKSSVTSQEIVDQVKQCIVEHKC